MSGNGATTLATHTTMDLSHISPWVKLASPYSVMKEDVQLDAKEGTGYEWEWGHDSGNSYNNGPFTHFAFGKASPYSVTKED